MKKLILGLALLMTMSVKAQKATITTSTIDERTEYLFKGKVVAVTEKNVLTHTDSSLNKNTVQKCVDDKMLNCMRNNWCECYDSDIDYAACTITFMRDCIAQQIIHDTIHPE